jgi:hypothetical protein
MAVLKAQVSSFSRVFDIPSEPVPAKGTFVATCLEVKDVFGVERKKFQSEETEKVDITAFRFGYRDKQGNPHQIASRDLKISSNEKSALFAFLKSWLGEAPKMGWDYCELKGAKALITVDHEQRKNGDGFYATIVSLSPLPEGMTEAAAPATPAPKAKTASKPAPAPVVIDDELDEVPF